MNTTVETQPLSFKIIDMIRSEIEKAENRKKLQQCFDPILIYAIKSIQPYIVTIFVLLVIVIFMLTYIVFKLHGCLNTLTPLNGTFT